MISFEEIEATITSAVECAKTEGKDKYDQFCSIGRFACDCGTTIDKMELRSYPHEDGMEVVGKDGKQWLYLHCPGCNYDWALWKLKLGLDPLRG